MEYRENRREENTSFLSFRRTRHVRHADGAPSAEGCWQELSQQVAKSQMPTRTQAVNQSGRGFTCLGIAASHRGC